MKDYEVQPFDDLVNQIMEEFNWEKVHKAMIATNWTWSFGEDKGIPSIDTLKRRAYSLLEEAYDNRSEVSTGGFSAGIDYGELYLVFTLTEFSAS